MRRVERTNTAEREPYFPSKRPLQRELGGPGPYMPQIAVMQRINRFVVLECDVRAKAKLRKCAVVSESPSRRDLASQRSEWLKPDG